MSVLIFELGGQWWERNREAADVLFSDLFVWGWLRRRVIERRLANAAVLFSATNAHERQSGSLPVESPPALLRKLARDLEAADPYTHGHSRRVARYASLIARRLDLTPSRVRQIRLAATLHDIGKLYTPREILDKPGRLTDAEFGIVKRHPGDGADMVASVIDDSELEAIVRHHHERLDGSGYPARLAAEEIPLGARIIAVADTFDAITSGRSYCKAQPHKAALDIMRDEAGTQLDPDAVRAFRSAYFGRRWLWIPAAAMNGVPRLLAAAATRLADSAAITASTAALGAGAFVLPIVPAQPSSTGTTRLASITRRLSRPQDSQVGPRHSITASLNAQALRAGTGSASESRRPKSKLTSKRGAPTVRKPGIGNPSPAVGTTTTEPISVAIPPGTAPSAIAKASLGANGSGVSASVSGPLSTSVSAATSPSASSLSASIPGATVVTAHPTQPLAAVNVRTPPGSILPSATASLP